MVVSVLAGPTFTNAVYIAASGSSLNRSSPDFEQEFLDFELTILELFRFTALTPLWLLAYAPRFDVYAVVCSVFFVVSLALELWTASIITGDSAGLSDSLKGTVWAITVFVVLVGCVSEWASVVSALAERHASRWSWCSSSDWGGRRR